MIGRVKEKGLGVLESFLLPVYTLIKPGRAYQRLRYIVKRSSPLVRAGMALLAYMGFALLSMIAVFLGSIYYSATHISGFSLRGVFGGLWAMLRAMLVYPFLAPLLLAALDTVLILIPAKLMEGETLNYLGVMLIRFSSLAGYAVKPGMIAVFESPSKLTLAEIYGAEPSNLLSMGILVFTYALTSYGLVRSGGVSWKTALASAFMPTLAHLLVGASS